MMVGFRSLVLAVCAVALALTFRAEAGKTVGMTTGDFNGDGIDDLAISAPGEDVDGANNAGAVQIIYGSNNGLRAKGNQFLSQDKAGVKSSAAAFEAFGTALVAGDFDGDGFADLAIGVPMETVSVASHAGAVNVLYGSPGGLRGKGSQFWTLDSAGVRGTAELEDRLGTALAAGDFDADGFVDLAIGAPGKMVDEASAAGCVLVLHGSDRGLNARRDQTWTQNSPGIADAAEINDAFGSALASGDFDGDGFADLAIDSAGETVNDFPRAGGVNVIYGSPTGLKAAGDQFWTQDSPGILDEAEDSDGFGTALAVGDFDGDGFADLACGESTETVDGYASAGAVNVLYGSRIGLRATGNQLWTQNSPDMVGEAGTGNAFGLALAAGDFNGDGFDDLAVGIPGEGFVTGGIQVILGSERGLTAAGNIHLNQDSPGVEDNAESIEAFGYVLAAGRFNRGKRVDLAVSVPFESVDDASRAGAVAVFYGSSAIFTGSNDQFWSQDSDGIDDDSEGFDFWGGL